MSSRTRSRASRARGSSSPAAQTLDLYWLEGYGGGVYLCFADATSGTETYGACRYLLDTVKGADLGETNGRLVLDFNFAYNPSCAYDPRWVCPLAPPGNRLPCGPRCERRREALAANERDCSARERRPISIGNAVYA